MTAAPLEVLRRIRRPPPRRDETERCDLCGAVVPAEHSHIVSLEPRRLMCGCRACALLFTSAGAGGGRYRTVPDRWLALDDLALTSQDWEALAIPVSVAFFFTSSTTGEATAFYPGPAGATESLLPLDAWRDLVDANPVLASAEADVEAVLVRVGRDAPDGRPEAYIVPVDICYELVGRLRQLWRGFDGGPEARAAIDAVFERVATRARRSEVSGWS